MFKRVLSLLLTLAMMLSLAPSTVLADDVNAPVVPETVVEEPVKEEPKAEEPAQEPVEGPVDEPVTDEPAADEPADEEVALGEVVVEDFQAVIDMIDALPEDITWESFDAVEAAGVAYQALQAPAAVVNSDKLTAAAQKLCELYAAAVAALPTEFVELTPEMHDAINAAADMGAKLDASLFVKGFAGELEASEALVLAASDEFRRWLTLLPWPRPKASSCCKKI